VTIVNTSSHEITWTHRFCAAIKWQCFLFLAFCFIGEHRRAARSQRVRAGNQRVHPHASATAAMLACPGSWTSESRTTTSYARGSHSPVLARMHQLKNKHAILSNMHKITNKLRRGEPPKERVRHGQMLFELFQKTPSRTLQSFVYFLCLC
jgi:hypothetical protein